MLPHSAPSLIHHSSFIIALSLSSRLEEHRALLQRLWHDGARRLQRRAGDGEVRGEEDGRSNSAKVSAESLQRTLSRESQLQGWAC